jgi:peptide chain release factor subunit 1
MSSFLENLYALLNELGRTDVPDAGIECGAMAESITWQELRELAGFRTERGVAVSLYLGLDPSIVPTGRDLASHTRSLLDGAERELKEQRGELSHEERMALERDLARIADWFGNEFDRDGVLGVALFAAELEGLFRTLLLSSPVDDRASIGSQLYVTPLVGLVGAGDGALVAYVGRERGDVYWLRGGRLVPLVDESADVPGRHDKGGWSQARYERHIETIVDRHLREVAHALDRSVRPLKDVRLVLAGPEETRSEFDKLLSHEVKAALVGWVAAEAHVDAPGLLEVARPLLGESRAAREEELLARWREEAGRDGRAATGWEETLQAASDGRVELLLVQQGAERTAHADLDSAIHQTLTHGGMVEVIDEEHRDLEPVGGIAALLRF